MPTRSWALPEELRQLAEGGEDDLVQEVLAVFQTDTGERLTRLRDALSHSDRAAVKAEAHAIKGGAGQVGAYSMASICQSIESQALTAPVLELEERVRQLEAAFRDVCLAMGA